MKKKFSAVFTAGALLGAAVIGTAACGGGEENLTFDREAPVFEAPKATISLDGNVDKASARNNISDTLFGVFLEDINYASYALDDNLLINYSFETAQGKTFANGALTNTPTTANTYGWHGEGGAAFSVKDNQKDGPLGELYKDYNGQYVNGGYATVTTTNGGRLVNDGFADPAMAVKENTAYVFSAFLRNNSSAAAELTLSVTDGTQVYATGTLSLPANSGWVKYQKKTITATKTGTEGLHFEIAFAGACNVSLDGVKLETTDATNGIKNYMYDAIKELSPKFIRFPGGCVIEGVDMATAYDWKNSIGAVATGKASTSDKVPAFEYQFNNEGTVTTRTTRGEQLTRRANTDIWYADGVYYEMEYGIGFYDYFLLCEGLGASPVPVLNAGYSDQGGIAWRKGPHNLEGRHGNELNDYLQDAIDLVCFANGSVDSSDANEAYWAQVRSDMGHPEPFGLKYLGIGNEQFDNNYYVFHYQKFVEKFAQLKAENEALFGSIELIVGNGMSLNDCQDSTKPGSQGTAQAKAEAYVSKPNAIIDTVAEYGVHDQHYYVNYMDLFTRTKMYDNYARPDDDPNSYYNVFVGEYSANSLKSFGDSYAATSPWTNSWITALSEAAMMTAYERNGDIIKLAAYAPMFASVNTAAGARQWNVDMMYFTNTDLVLTSNYYVQQLFMKHQGKYLLSEPTIEYADGFESTYLLKPEAGSAYSKIDGESDKLYVNGAEISKLYYVASMNTDGDIVLKIVNASGEDIDINIALNNVKLRGIAKITALQNDSIKAVNTAQNEQIKPEEYTVGKFSNTLGYTAKKYSVTAIVIDLK